MSTVGSDGSTAGGRIGRAWTALSAGVLATILLQSMTADRILSGDHWRRTVHRTLAEVLIAVTAGAGVATLVVVRHLRHHPGRDRLGAALISLGACLAVQFGLGTAATDGTATLWLHIPLGVALVAAGAQTTRLVRRVADPTMPSVRRTRDG